MNEENKVFMDCVKCGRILEEINEKNLKKMKVPRLFKPMVKKALKDPKKSAILYRVIRTACLPKCADYGLKCQDIKKVI